MPLPPNTRTARQILQGSGMPEDRIPIVLHVIEAVRLLRTKPPSELTARDLDTLAPAGTTIVFLSCSSGNLYSDAAGVCERYSLDFAIRQPPHRDVRREFVIEVRFRQNCVISVTIRSPLLARRIMIKIE